MVAKFVQTNNASSSIKTAIKSDMASYTILQQFGEKDIEFIFVLTKHSKTVLKQHIFRKNPKTFLPVAKFCVELPCRLT